MSLHFIPVRALSFLLLCSSACAGDDARRSSDEATDAPLVKR